jgi:ribonuclease R
LGKDLYTHFTSPIRRYPDLMTHRILKDVLSGRVPGEIPLSEAARVCSERERAAEEAERDLLEWRIYRFLRPRLGDEFPGSVVDITKAGLVVELDGLFVTGLILFQDLGEEYFERDSETSLKGRRTGKSLRVGERLDVILASIEPDERRMLLVPAAALP